MLPLKDNIPTDRLPLVTLLLIAAGVLAALLGAGDALRLLVALPFLWLFGPSVEDAMSRPRYAAYCLLASALAVGARAALAPGGALAGAAAAGVAAAVVAGHALRYPRARFVAVVLVPLACGLAELPAWTLLAGWVALQTALALAGGADGWAAFAAQAAAFAFGLLAIGAFAQRRKALPPVSTARRAGAAAP